MRYYSFNTYLQQRHGVRVHRLSLNAGFGCPNKDGTISGEGCVFCNERAFSRFSDDPPPLEEQITKSMESAGKRYGARKFIAYFQSGSNTYAAPGELKAAYNIIRKFKDIVGLYISTRPDCIDDEKLEMIGSFTEDYEVWVEYGVQTVHEKTLKAVNRGHTFDLAEKAINDTARKGIKVGAHLIIGLPGEEESDMLATIKVISGLPVSGVKFHVLHVLKDTPLESAFLEGRIKLLDKDGYIDIICKILGHLPKDCVVLRLVSDARSDLLVAPQWVLEKQRVILQIEEKLKELDLFQGKFV